MNLMNMNNNTSSNFGLNSSNAFHNEEFAYGEIKVEVRPLSRQN